MEFKKYQHVCRYGTADTQGILSGECVIMPKIDGTNASVWLDENGEVQCGSRKRQLAFGKDNAGFYTFVMSELGESIRNYLKEHPTHRLYGEWLVPHSLKTYNDNAWKKFYVFDVMCNVGEDTEHYIPFKEYQPLLEQFGIDYIPPIATVMNPTIDQLKEFVSNNHFLMQDGCVGEGIVIKNYNYKNTYGHIVWAKIINNEFKNGGSTKAKVKDLKEVDTEGEIAKRYCTNALINKEYAKILNDNPDIDRKVLIPRLIENVFHSIVSEDMYDICKTFKLPIINMKVLKTQCINRIKEVKVELFV